MDFAVPRIRGGEGKIHLRKICVSQSDLRSKSSYRRRPRISVPIFDKIKLVLEAENIRFSYGREPVLDGVSFAVAPGETVVLAGPNGAGKTTLMRVLAGLYAPQGGRVCADGRDIALAPLRYHRSLGWLGAGAGDDADLTVKAFLKYRAFFKGEQTRKIRYRVQEAVAACRLGEVVNEPVSRLSDGTQKRVALAEAILLRPRFLLLDDLMAGLDPASRSSLGDALAAVRGFSAVVVSGHELEEYASFATRYLVLRGGRISEVRTAAEARKAVMA